MLNLFLFISIAFLLTFLIGRLFEKINVPWIFAALIIGAILSINNPFESITSTPTFSFLSELGMLFLLFIIGFEISLKETMKRSKFIIKATFFIIFLEGLIGSLLIHFLFNYSWFISMLVSLSFATVGEVILIPILDKFNLINTKLGQSLIGIGVLDDVIEIALLLIIVFIVGTGVHAHVDVGIVLISIFALVFLLIGFIKLKNKSEKLMLLDFNSLFLFTVFLLFLFIGIGEYAEVTPIAALLAGVSLARFLPKNKLELIKTQVKTISYGFFAPLFFLNVGLSMNLNYLFNYPLLVILIILVSKGSKILASLLIGIKELGLKQSILLGIGLSVRFSTSIILIKILYDAKIIGIELYSIIVASSIAFNFIIPLLFSKLVKKWVKTN